jgi:glucose-6-phosphate 1-dehydrogenase
MSDTRQTDGRQPAPNTVVIFGASGDLTHRKLLPALWNLYSEKRLPEQFSVVGMARSPKTDESFRTEARDAVGHFARDWEVDCDRWKRFASGLFYLQGQYDDPEAYARLKALLEKLCAERGSCRNYLHYLATPPSGYVGIVRQLGEAGLAQEGGESGWARIIVEKPFGSDLDSARRLNEELRQVFREEQIYRIDHYLGKETVQNLLVFRFANGIFEPFWNRRYVDHVQISVAEQLGVEGRGSYYEEAGALRDMVQNHLMQVMCMVAMEAPARFHHQAVRNEKVKVLESVRAIEESEVKLWTARGQYAPGEVDGELVPGYLQEPGVARGSRTETFAAVRFMIDNWRWANVPFFLRTGKRLPSRVTEVTMHFRMAPHQLFRDFECPMERNVLTVRIQPNEGIGLRFAVKVPGAGMTVRPVTMHFDYAEEFKSEPPEAYERLLLDCMLGDITLFSRDDWMDRSWELIAPIQKAWSRDRSPLPQYAAGTWGPAEAEALIQREGRDWWAPE